MALLKSIFCLQGADTRIRFLVINFICYITFLISDTLFANQIYLNTFILLSLVTVIALTSLRRLNDVQFKKNWCGAPSISFLIAGVIIISTADNSAQWLLLVPFILSLPFMAYPSQTENTYILGYCGPVNLSEFDAANVNKQRHNQRIEPVIITDLQNQGTPITNNNAGQQQAHNTYTSLSSNRITPPTLVKKSNVSDIGVFISLKSFCHKNSTRILIVISLLFILTITSSFILSSFQRNEQPRENNTKPDVTLVRTARVAFPDNFSLLLSRHRGLIINWQADSDDDKKIWDLETAQGNKNCQDIVFNNGIKIRTTSVLVEDTEQYFANFSPLDTHNLLQEIAFRDDFMLCGYKFSLKGSQAILGKHIEYAKMVTY